MPGIVKSDARACYFKNMPSVIDILELLESDNSRLFKEDVLESNNDNELLRRIFQIVGDPYTNFYVSKFRVPKEQSHHEEDDFVVESFLKMLTEELATRAVTGNSAKGAVEQFFLTLDARQAKWCTRILLKNLRCGVQAATVNKVWPGTIVGFSVQLAETLKTQHDPQVGIVIKDRIKYPVRVEPKLDGLRCVAVKHNGEVSLFTRSGSVIDTLPRIKDLLEAAPWDDFVLDGEVMGKDWNESASVVMSRKSNKDDSNMIFHVFDAMPFVDWRDQDSNITLEQRVELLEELVGMIDQPFGGVVTVRGVIVNDQRELLEHYSRFNDEGYEGAMVKDMASPYIFKRTEAVRKLKPIATYEGVVVGNYLGTRGSRREDLWGGFIVLLPNGVMTRVGGGFNDKLKAEINMDPKSWVGRIVEVEGQPDPATADGLTKDGKIRFPVFIRERDPRDVDPRVVAAYRKFKGEV
jgi:ATP-dependent DNA ligase